MRIVEGASTTRYYVDGGFVQVVDNLVSVLTNRAVPAEALKPAIIEEQLTAARSRVRQTRPNCSRSASAPKPRPARNCGSHNTPAISPPDITKSQDRPTADKENDRG
jgi:hypothetical protein